MSKIEISEYGNLLIFKKGYSSPEVKKIIQQNNLNGLRIFMPFKSDVITNFEFLNEYDFLETLEISVTSNEYDFTFLNYLVNLKKLSIHIIGKGEIDLSRLEKLEECTLLWRKNIVGLSNCQSLKKLCLIDFKQSDLSGISDLCNLTQLVIKTSSIQTLRGIQNMKRLEFILLGNCKKLVSIGDLNGLLLLKAIELNGCSNIYDFSSLINLPSINSLRLFDCKQIKSVAFIENLKSLEEFYYLGNSKIIDPDLSPLKKLIKVLP